MAWSNTRENLIDKGVFRMTVRCRFTEKALGTRPANDEIYREFIASKAPDAATTEAEVAAKGVDAVVEKGITIFPVGSFFRTPQGVYYDFNDMFNAEAQRKKDEPEIEWPTDVYGNIITRHDGVSVYFNEERKLIPYYVNGSDRSKPVPGEFVECPFMYDYQMRGSFKEAIKHLQKVSKESSNTEAITVEEESAPAVPEKVETPTISEPVVVENGEKLKRKRRTKEEIGADRIRKEEEKARKKAEREAAKAAKAAANAGNRYACAELKSYRSVVDGSWLVEQRRIPLIVPETFVDDTGVVRSTYVVDNAGARRLNLFQRPLRAETMQGPRVSLASSEMIPAGSEFYFTVKLLNPKHRFAFYETMDYKAISGMFQWRSGGMGTLIWTPADEFGNPIDVDLTK